VVVHSLTGGFLLTRDSIRFVLPALAFSAFTLLASSPAAAQSIAEPRTWTVTPFLVTSAGIGNPAPDNSGGIGVAVGYDLTHNLGFEGEVSHLFDIAGDDEDVDWPVTNVSANAVYHFDVKHVTPYATAGIGFERSDPGVDNLPGLFPNGSSEVTFNLGGGVKYPLNGRWLVRGDLRRFLANDLAPDFWRVYGGLTIVLNPK
jgi:opacity protein-like surface antigen